MMQFHTVADKVENVRVFSCLTLKPYDFYMKPEMKGHFELASWFHAPGPRAALKANVGTVTYVPNMLHRAAADFIYARKPNIFWGTCTPPDKHGFVSLSLGITYEKDILEASDLVILEVNPRLPRTLAILIFILLKLIISWSAINQSLNSPLRNQTNWTSL